MVSRFKLYTTTIGVAVVALLIIFFWIEFKSQEKTKETVYLSDPEVLIKGEKLFEDNCSSCHNFSHNSIGPGLQNTTNRLPKKWLKSFIRNAPEMISKKDARSMKLYEQFKQVMPPFTNLTSKEVDALLAYMHQNQSNEEGTQETNDFYLKDPVPARIPYTGGKLYLTTHSIAPASGTKAPMARINNMRTLDGMQERMFVIDLQGILYEIRDKQWTVAMDIKKLRSDFVSSPGLGTGFGSFAFHPDFDENRLLYTTHAEKYKNTPGDLGFEDTIEVGLQWILTEWKVEDPLELPFKVKGREVLRIDLLTPFHGVQEISFNPYALQSDEDYGLLYICVGDGGAGEKGYDYLCNSPNYASSSVLRIDPLGRNSKNGEYGIPPSNPFVNDTSSYVLKEIYCRGFRNPNRISWTPNGKMLISDIGQSNIEEINIGESGADYGWPVREGTFMIDTKGDVSKVSALPDGELPSKFTYPVLQYDHDEGRAISGGFVYNGSAIPELKNKYVFADITNGRFFVTENTQMNIGGMASIKELEIWIDNEKTTFQEVNGPAKPDPRLGIGLKGELYVFTKADGKLYKVVDYKPD
ncbi:PQQ-dependent sugar dehydrogenase [Membranihabitans maritimus]|uniref:PQQ-dependent sugar dehydrogenase n=1 Tax=Membranihabitans maritimus TaxID=2904244 RepID=UPI001F2CCF2B|nr:PQQ-dependent sugar dehydrogenase [Membranihabitans maritimus]